MKRDLGRDLIEGLRDSTNVEFVENLNLTIFSLVDEAFKALSQKSSFIQADKVYFMPVNEVSTHAMTSQSVYSYFLGVANTEIELNSLDKTHYLKNSLLKNNQHFQVRFQSTMRLFLPIFL